MAGRDSIRESGKYLWTAPTTCFLSENYPSYPWLWVVTTVAGNRYSLTVWLEVTAILGDTRALR